MYGTMTTERIYYSPTMFKITAAKRGARQEGSRVDDDGDEENEGASVKTSKGESNLSPNPKAKITGFFKPIAKVQKKKSEEDEESGSVSVASAQKSEEKAGPSLEDDSMSDQAHSSTISPHKDASISDPVLSSKTSPQKDIKPANPQPKITVIQSDTLNAAQAFLDPMAKHRRITVLNMASFLRPGGGVVNGAIAQEESLCLRSTLYPALDEKFYRLPKFGGLYTQDILVRIPFCTYVHSWSWRFLESS